MTKVKVTLCRMQETAAVERAMVSHQTPGLGPGGLVGVTDTSVQNK